MLTEPERLYARLLERLDQLVPSYSSSLQVVDGNASKIVTCRGNLDPEVVMGLRFPMDPLYPNYEVVKKKRPVSFADIRDAYPHFSSRQEEFSSGHIRSWLGVPMVVVDIVVGMIAMDRNVVDPFDDEETRIVRAFADQAAVAIRNAKVYRRLQEAYAAQGALMREMNHRVKNSLQLVSSLIAIHAGQTDDPSARLVFTELQARIASVSSIHKRLYERKEMSGVDLDEYLRDLAYDVFNSFVGTGAPIELETREVPMSVDMAVAMPLGLILSELMMNALKYAFPGTSGGIIRVSLSRSADGGVLRVEDTGVGFSPESVEAKGFGILLIRNLSAQIQGLAEIESSPGSTVWTVRFPLSERTVEPSA